MTRLMPLCLLLVAGLGANAPDVAGTYETRVTLIRSNCTLPVQSNPTEVAQYGDSVITLRHAGTTYVAKLAADTSFKAEPKHVSVGGVDYEITVTGRFSGDAIDARVVLRYGQPECLVEVGWQGPRRR